MLERVRGAFKSNLDASLHSELRCLKKKFSEKDFLSTELLFKNVEKRQIVKNASVEIYFPKVFSEEYKKVAALK